MGGEHFERGVHPKIVALLGRPEAHRARLTLATCAELGVSPSVFTGRPTVTTTVVTDGVTRTTTASQWSPEDQALMMAWREYQDGLCADCGHPKATAWHPFSEGWFEAQEPITCWACTAARPRNDDGTVSAVTFPVVVDTRDHDADPLPAIPT